MMPRHFIVILSLSLSVSIIIGCLSRASEQPPPRIFHSFFPAPSQLLPRTRCHNGDNIFIFTLLLGSKGLCQGLWKKPPGDVGNVGLIQNGHAVEELGKLWDREEEGGEGDEVLEPLGGVLL